MTDAEKLDALEKLLKQWLGDRDSFCSERQEYSPDTHSYFAADASEVAIGCCIYDVRQILAK